MIKLHNILLFIVCILIIIPIASAGNIVTSNISGNYTIQTFTYSATGGNTTFNIPNDVVLIDYLMVGGGAGSALGGGGGGGYIEGTDLAVGSGETIYNVSVGAGGVGVGSNDGVPSNMGGNTTFRTLVAYGGGPAAPINYGSAPAGPYGTGGGGASDGGGAGIGGTGIVGQGYNGGGGRGDTNQASGGGGGAGSAGTNATSTVKSGNGGYGKASILSGINTTYGGGGGGGHWTSATGGGTGNDGGGGGDKTGGHAGANDRGGGAGGGGADGGGANGGSGIIIIKYLTPSFDSVTDNFTRQDGQINRTYTFTGQFVDSKTGEIILSVKIIDNLGFSTSITNGTFSNVYSYGTVQFTSKASKYTTTITNVVIDHDIAQNISMVSSTATDQVVYITPHKVRFVAKDIWGNSISNMLVSAVGVQTTLGSIDWIASLFGINIDATPITDLMSGTTGDDGSIVFVMLETEKYAVTFSKISANINETRYYYPKSEEYTEIFWPDELPPSSSVLDYPFFNTSFNATYTTLGINYTDTGLTTTEFTFFVDNKSGERLYTEVRSGVGNSTINVSFTAKNIVGGGYFWSFIANNTKYATPITKTNYLAFNDAQWMVNPMGAPNGDSTATWVYNSSAVGLICIFGLIFGRASIKFGVVVTPLMGLLFWYIGWLNTPITLIMIAMGLGILLYMRYSEEESGI